MSITLTVWVARTLQRNGAYFLHDAFLGKERLADSVNHLLGVGFYLMNIGYVALSLKEQYDETCGFCVSCARWLGEKIPGAGMLIDSVVQAFLSFDPMWGIKNRTAYAAERNWTRDKDGVHWWLVAVKATFDLAPGGLAPEYFGEPGRSSLRYDSDLLMAKPGTDVLVLVHAHAPRGRPALTVPVSLRIERLHKELPVHGERLYDSGWRDVTVTRPQPFTTRPIRYEFAFGGSDLSDPDPKQHRIDERNPIGRGFARRVAHVVGKLAHAIEYPRGEPAEMGPAGFGPIDSSWMPRRKLAGTYDVRWEQTKKPLLPDDFEPSFALSAPVDQRTEKPLVGGERVEFLNMTPDGVLRFELPRISLGFTTRISTRGEQHGCRLTTVLVEPEERRLSLVWQSVLRVRAPEADYLDETEIVEQRSAA